MDLHARRLSRNVRVLGLRVFENDGVLQWKRDADVPACPEFPIRRQLFSWCGKIISHYPIAGWLRVACSYIKRRTTGIS